MEEDRLRREERRRTYNAMRGIPDGAVVNNEEEDFVGDVNPNVSFKLHIFSVAFSPNERKTLKNFGDKVCVPPEVLQRFRFLVFHFFSFFLILFLALCVRGCNCQQLLKSPVLKILCKSPPVESHPILNFAFFSYCGVAEFNAAEGSCFAPTWMLSALEVMLFFWCVLFCLTQKRNSR